MTVSTDTTRRALLGGAGLIAAATLPAFAAVTMGPTPAASQVSPALAKLIADFHAADARIDRFYDTTYNPAVEREAAMCKAVPHVTIPMNEGWRGDPAFFSTDNRQGVRVAQHLVRSEPRTSKRSDVVRARKLVAALHRRERKFQQIARDSGRAAASKREDELWVPIKAATAAIMAFPAASAADMLAKLDHLESVGVCDHDDPGVLFEIVRADAARLAGEARV